MSDLVDYFGQHRRVPEHSEYTQRHNGREHSHPIHDNGQERRDQQEVPRGTGHPPQDVRGMGSYLSVSTNPVCLLSARTFEDWSRCWTIFKIDSSCTINPDLPLLTCPVDASINNIIILQSTLFSLSLSPPVYTSK